MPGAPKSYLTQLGRAVCMQIVQDFLSTPFPQNVQDVALRGQPRWHEDMDTGCWLWAGRLLPEGYVQFKRGGENYMLHRLSFVAKWGVDIIHSASHLCSRPNCFNPDHIIDENMTRNNARKGCPGDVTCPNGHLLLPCQHDPKCIQRRRADAQCCFDHRPSTPIFIAPAPSSPPARSPSRAPALGGAGAVFESSPPIRTGRRRLTLPVVSSSDPVLPGRQLTAVPESSPPIRTGRRPTPAPRSPSLPPAPPPSQINDFLQVDASQLDGAERLGEILTSDFVVEDDYVEFETSSGDDMEGLEGLD